MTRSLRRILEPSFAAAALWLVAGGNARGLDATEWKYRQALPIAAPGLQKLALPPETLGRARPGLEDLRFLDPAGREVPFVVTRPAPPVPATQQAPQAFRAILGDSATQLLIDTGTPRPIEAVTLTSPAPGFLKAVRLELTADGSQWEVIADGAAIFRQFGATELRLEVPRRRAMQVRVTIDDTRSRAVPFTGARLQLAGAAAPELTAPVAVRLAQREEFAGETVLTLDLGGANVPLAGLEFATADPLFARTVSLHTRELREGVAVERIHDSGTIWRLAADGARAASRLEVPLHFTAPTRELLVHVANGDSPPLAIEQVTARQRPVWVVLHAPEPGAYAVLTGHPQIAAPRYDLAELGAALRDTPPGNLVPGPAEPNPGYRPRDPLADTPLRGGAIDVAPWMFRKAVQLAAAGVHQLELDPEVLAGAQPGLGDLRLVRAEAQVPYLLERPALTRARSLAVTPANDPRQPRLSRWQLRLPRAGLPVVRLTLASPSALFQRHLRLYEKVPDARQGEDVPRPLAAAAWSHAPGDTRSLTLTLSDQPRGELLWLETDNGDNPPIELTSAQVSYPVARMLFKAEPGALALYYGHRAALAPRYDLALVAEPILAAEKSLATLGAEERMHAGGWTAEWLGGTRARWVFWGVLALVVVGLLVIVAKLLPKPPASPG